MAKGPVNQCPALKVTVLFPRQLSGVHVCAARNAQRRQRVWVTPARRLGCCTLDHANTVLRRWASYFLLRVVFFVTLKMFASHMEIECE